MVVNCSHSADGRLRALSDTAAERYSREGRRTVGILLSV